MKPDQERVRQLLTETVTLLCRNGLQYNKQMKVQGLLGITLDDQDVVLVQIDETIGDLLTALPPSVYSEARDNEADVSASEIDASAVDSGLNLAKRRGGKRTARPLRQVSKSSHHYRRGTRSSQPYSRSSSTTTHFKHSQAGISNSISQITAAAADLCKHQSEGYEDETFLQNSRTDECIGTVKVKMEDDEIIIVDVDRKISGDILQHERRAVLDSYLSEASPADTSFAQHILSKFSNEKPPANIGLDSLGGRYGDEGPYSAELQGDADDDEGDGDAGGGGDGSSNSKSSPSLWQVSSSSLAASSSFNASINQNIPSVSQFTDLMR